MLRIQKRILWSSSKENQTFTGFDLCFLRGLAPNSAYLQCWDTAHWCASVPLSGLLRALVEGSECFSLFCFFSLFEDFESVLHFRGVCCCCCCWCWWCWCWCWCFFCVCACVFFVLEVLMVYPISVILCHLYICFFSWRASFLFWSFLWKIPPAKKGPLKAPKAISGPKSTARELQTTGKTLRNLPCSFLKRCIECIVWNQRGVFFLGDFYGASRNWCLLAPSSQSKKSPPNNKEYLPHPIHPPTQTHAPTLHAPRTPPSKQVRTWRPRS